MKVGETSSMAAHEFTTFLHRFYKKQSREGERKGEAAQREASQQEISLLGVPQLHPVSLYGHLRHGRITGDSWNGELPSSGRSEAAPAAYIKEAAAEYGDSLCTQPKPAASNYKRESILHPCSWETWSPPARTIPNSTRTVTWRKKGSQHWGHHLPPSPGRTQGFTLLKVRRGFFYFIILFFVACWRVGCIFFY